VLTVQKYFYEQAVSNCISRMPKRLLRILQQYRVCDGILCRNCTKSSCIPGLWYFLQKLVAKLSQCSYEEFISS